MSQDPCSACNSKGYLVATRDDGYLAVERCDSCTFSIPDGEAARHARRDGIMCRLSYPCYVLDPKGEFVREED